MRAARALGGLALALLLAAGCAKAPPKPVDTSQVLMPKSYRYDPVVIRVPAGTKVTWTNQDNFTHSVFVQETKQLLNPIAPGESRSLTFDQPGEYHIICTYHTQNMKGTVIVTPRG